MAEELVNNGKNIEKKPIRNEKGQLLPGVVLNPAGKPKGTKHFATLFKELLQEQVKLKDGTKITMLKAMGLAMAQKAMKGDVNAFNAVSDRLDGKPNQSIEMEVTEPPVPIYGGRSIKKKP